MWVLRHFSFAAANGPNAPPSTVSGIVTNLGPYTNLLLVRLSESARCSNMSMHHQTTL